MNTIPNKQNEERNLNLLAAQRQLYSTSKVIFGVQTFLSVPLAISLTIWSLSNPSIKAYTALWGMIVVIADLIWLSPWNKKLRSIAAATQETFDCIVLDLPRADFRTGKSPDPECIKEQSSKYKKSANSMPTLIDWYDPCVGELPIHIGRIICQRTNCWWDSKQRRLYANTIIIGVVIILSSVILPAILMNISLQSFILVMNSLFPVFVFGYKQYTEHTEAAIRLDSLKVFSESVWKEAMANKDQTEITNLSRDLQSEIYDGRKKSPLFFDFIFKKIRNNFEVQMNHGARHYTDEAKRTLNL